VTQRRLMVRFIPRGASALARNAIGGSRFQKSRRDSNNDTRTRLESSASSRPRECSYLHRKTPRVKQRRCAAHLYRASHRSAIDARLTFLLLSLFFLFPFFTDRGAERRRRSAPSTASFGVIDDSAIVNNNRRAERRKERKKRDEGEGGGGGGGGGGTETSKTNSTLPNTIITHGIKKFPLPPRVGDTTLRRCADRRFVRDRRSAK